MVQFIYRGLTNIGYLHLNEIKFRNIDLFDDVFADRMNTGLDWMWVEILTVMDWIGLGQ